MKSLIFAQNILRILRLDAKFICMYFPSGVGVWRGVLCWPGKDRRRAAVLLGDRPADLRKVVGYRQTGLGPRSGAGRCVSEQFYTLPDLVGGHKV